ncbi:MAG: 3-oxoacyl-[acyl-carrier-protein] reductase [Syntrophorhabdales bacterium]
MKGRVAVVTGASQGIGRAVAEFLAEKGGSVAIIDVADGTDTVRAIEAKGSKALFFQADVSDGREVEKAVTGIAEGMGGIDCLVNNAGITRDRLLLRMTEDEWDLVMRVNLKGVYTCTKAVLRHMMKKGGSIVNISSIAGLTGNAGQSNYAAAKAGIVGFTKSVAREYAERGIRVNAVAPGFIATELTARLDEKYREAIRQSIPLKRAGEPIEVARVVYFLLSEYSGYITGEVINVSGGLYI